MLDEIFSVLIGVPATIIFWELAFMFGKIIYDDYKKDEEKY